MIAEQERIAVLSKSRQHITFFRQSGWMMIWSTLMGVLFALANKPASRMSKEEYSLYGTMLALIGQMGIPAVGLLGIFIQQAAASLNAKHERELAGVFRGVLRGTFVLWMVMVAVVFALRHSIIEAFGISNPAALWVAVLAVLAMLWRPVLLGVMQGRQNFLWCGWTSIIEGVVRLGGVCLAVFALGWHASGALTAVLIASLIVVGIGGWFARDCFLGEAVPVDWRAWLGRVVPLTLGLGVATIMLSADLIFVRHFFSKQSTGYYVAAGTVGRALVYFTTPLVAVMFPKIVRSAALGEESSALKLTLVLTALVGGGAAVMCTLLPWLPLRIMTNQSYVSVAAPLVPWFVWCMLPLTLSTILINYLMARSRFSSVPWLVAVAVAYGLALYFHLNAHHDDFRVAIQLIGFFGITVFGVSAWFSFHAPRTGGATVRQVSST